jgi:hypothetical protein
MNWCGCGRNWQPGDLITCAACNHAYRYGSASLGEWRTEQREKSNRLDQEVLLLAMERVTKQARKGGEG